MLAQREEGCYLLKLYQLQNFYIEVTRHKHFHAIQKVCMFSSAEKLLFYLDEINIDPLFS